MLKARSVEILEKGIKPGVTVQSFHAGFFSRFEIPLPPLEVQKEIVAEIEAEQALVAANRELITRFEKKIQATLARVWGGAEPVAATGPVSPGTASPSADLRAPSMSEMLPH